MAEEQCKRPWALDWDINQASWLETTGLRLLLGANWRVRWVKHCRPSQTAEAKVLLDTCNLSSLLSNYISKKYIGIVKGLETILKSAKKKVSSNRGKVLIGPSSCRVTFNPNKRMTPLVQGYHLPRCSWQVNALNWSSAIFRISACSADQEAEKSHETHQRHNGSFVQVRETQNVI